MANTAILAGASGLIGSSLLDLLLSAPEYGQVLVLVRKELPLNHPKLKQLVVDFDKLDNYAQKISGNVVFSCLGSTRKKTPDLALYRKIDHDYLLQLAKIAMKNGSEQFHLVSSSGADINSSFFYGRLKGETEDDIIKVGIISLSIYRPAMLTGKRSGDRSIENVYAAVMKMIDPLLIGSLKKYRSIAGTTVAMAMYKQSLKQTGGVFIYPSDKIKELA